MDLAFIIISQFLKIINVDGLTLITTFSKTIKLPKQYKNIKNFKI